MAKKKAVTKKVSLKRAVSKPSVAKKEPELEVPHDVSSRQHAMSKQGFNNVIRLCKTASLDRVAQLRQSTFVNLKRLGVKRDSSKAVAGVPNGSDQHDLMSLFVWAANIRAEDKDAIKQLVAIDATCVARSG